MQPDEIDENGLDKELMLKFSKDALGVVKAELRKDLILSAYRIFMGFVTLVFACGVASYISMKYDGNDYVFLFVLLFLAYDALMARIFGQNTLIERVGHVIKETGEGIYLIIRDRKRQM